MEKVIVEKTVYETKYQAADGKMFNNEDACMGYENTLKCIARAKYNSLVVKHITEYDIIPFGNEEAYIDVVKLKTMADVETVIHLLNAYQTRSQEEIETLLDNLKKIKENKEDYLLLFAGNEYDGPWYGYLGSAKEFLEKAKNSIFDSSKKDVKQVFSKEKIEEMLNKPIRVYNPYKNYLENNKTIVINKPLGLEIYW